MSLTSFLFNGTPPASTTTYGSSTSSMPAWYSDYTQGLISKANAIAATPYQQYQGARIAEQTPYQQRAFEQTANNAANWQDRLGFNQAQGTLNNLQQPGQSSITPQAQGLYNQAIGINPTQMAQPNYQAANQSFSTAQLPAFMATQPYIAQQQQLLNPIFDNMARQNAERLAGAESAVTDRAIAAGGYGGSRMGVGIGQARRQSLADLAGQKAGLANTAYQNALQAGQADLARQIQAGTALQSLGTAQAGLGSQQQQFLTGTGRDLSTLTAGDLQRRLDAARTQGSLGQTQSDVGVRQLQALEAAGLSQQQQAQRNLDLGYQDFQNQLQHPYNQISFLNNAIRGLQIPTATQTSSTGPASVYGPSPFATILGGVGALGSLGGLGRS